MSFSIELKCVAPPPVVLDAIREELREWRESQIPRDLWKEGVMQVLGNVSTTDFRLFYSRRWARTPGPELSGVVVADLADGSIVRARCGIPRYLWVVPLGLALLGYVLSLFGTNAALVAFGLAGVVALQSLLQDSLISRSSAQAAYLVTRLEHALSSAAQHHSPHAS